MFNKTEWRNKKHFCNYCLQCFSSGTALTKHKDLCLKTNRKQSVELKIGSIKFKIYWKQLAVPFKNYSDTECNLEKFMSMIEIKTLHILKNT